MLSELSTYISEKIGDKAYRIPLLLFALPLLYAAFSVFYYLWFTVFGASWFLNRIGSFFGVLARISFFLTGLYFALLFWKEKKLAFAAVALLFVIRAFFPMMNFDPSFWGMAVVWLLCGLAVVLPEMLNHEDAFQFGNPAACAVGAVFVLNFLYSLIKPYRFIPFLRGILYLIYAAALFAELILLLSVVLHITEECGGAEDTLFGIIGSLKNRGNLTEATVSQNTDAPEAEVPEVTRTSPDAQAPCGLDAESAVLPVEAESLPAEIRAMEGITVVGGRRYKTVAGPVGLTVGHKDSYAEGVKIYASLIDRETVGGWKLDKIRKIPVTKKAGCLAALLGQRDTTVFFNILIFVKED